MKPIASLSGMQPEYDVAKTIADTALYGTARNDLGSVVPVTAAGLVSFGVCGGLDPKLKRGSLIIPSVVTTANGTYATNTEWTGVIEWALETEAKITTNLAVHALSSPNVWASDPASRAALFARTGCGILDNESCAVAEFCGLRNLPFIVLRAVSDESDDTVVNDPNEVTPTGGVNILVDIRDFILNPAEIVHEAIGFGQAMDTLKAVAAGLGKGLLFPL